MGFSAGLYVLVVQKLTGFEDVARDETQGLFVCSGVAGRPAGNFECVA